MPRPKKEGAPEPKRRSRHGCWPCKSRKIKCGEERPACENCQRLKDTCDYSIRLNWGGRPKKGVGQAPTSPLFSTWDPKQSQQPYSQQSSNQVSFQLSNELVESSDQCATHPSNHDRQTASSPSMPPPPSQRPSLEPPPVEQVAKRRKTGPSHYTSPAVQLSQLHSMPMTPDSPPTDKSPDLRRMSVKSLLSDAAEEAPSEAEVAAQSNHGFDQGRPDIDLPRNDDEAALLVFSPSSTLRRLQSPLALALTPPEAEYFGEFGFGLRAPRDSHFQLDEYYSEPVAVQIPRALEPLPDLLHANPMNLLYFHHFLNHTARILVPHDCPENPFRTLLPAMACSDGNLLNLLLAYSASHRARLLKHPEPHNRIAGYMEGVFPSLQEALFGDASQKPVTDANLATAIMLASLEIISPNAFEVPVTWQTHLQIAWQMIAARGGYRQLLHSSPVAYFLARWFSYLDVVGSLSGSRRERSHMSDYDIAELDPEVDATVDCLLGFRSSAVTLLARVADLAMRCDAERIREDGTIDPSWQPPADVAHEALNLEASLLLQQQTRFSEATHKRCGHHAATPLAPADVAEAAAIDDGYHLAGRIHLYCRVLGLERTDPKVQECVQATVAAIEHIRALGSAEACMLLPLFTAGCEAVDEQHQRVIERRLAGVELSGMSQVHKARLLLHRVWRTGSRWETLARGEFLG